MKHTNHTITVAGTDPMQSATVQASAGSGKTWLLVTRLLRLILAGESASEILALTFTRKAAGEMQQRLRERLRHLALCSETELTAALQTIGLDDTARHRAAARQAFEGLLLEPFTLRTSTFHSFCQDILQQFALEAELPSEFGLLEDETETINTAWFTLLHELTAANQRSVLTRYIDAIGSMASAEKALHGFLHHRLDWWAYTQACAEDNVTPASRLRDYFQPAASRDQIFRDCFVAIHDDDLEYYAAVLQAWGRSTGLQAREKILACLVEAEQVKRFDYLYSAVLTKTNTPRKYAANTVDKAAASAGLSGERFFTLHERFAAELLDNLDALNRYNNFQLNLDWQNLGQQLLTIYQRIKAEQGVLDFADLEWRTVQLLTDPTLGHWVQYKLDQRIRHILIDEFQDTSPTQWTLLYPLLEEITAGHADKNRHNTDNTGSLFIVGDDKQSIYGFRRADPQLLGSASHWIAAQTADSPKPAAQITLAKSYRSSPVIMQVVNNVFRDQLPDFPEHDTQLQALWGQVTLLPVVDADAVQAVAINETEPTSDSTHLRNPLTTPREVLYNPRPILEAKQIADEIQQLITNRLPLQDGNGTRSAGYGDIIILLRKRTHAAPIEQALRALSIPFIGADRDSFASSQEIQDVQALLRVLHSPWDNLACAQVLRSPMFAWDDAAVATLAQYVMSHTTQGSWLLTLLDNAEGDRFDTRTIDLLNQWRELALVLPTHDLLDHIIHQSDWLARYRLAYPPSLHARLVANMQHVCRLALATDGGRYPSLRRFNERISAMQTALTNMDNAVQIMTIHAAKGLEAPIVFVANTAHYHAPNQAWQPVVHWPAGQASPSQILLRPSQAKLDQNSAALIAAQQERETREQLNLLYVALTRAKQYCWISGFRGQRDDGTGNSWWDLVQQGLQAIENIETQPSGALALRSAQAIPSIQPQYNDSEQTNSRHPNPEPADTRPAALLQSATVIADQGQHNQKDQLAITPSAAPQQDVNDRIELDGTADSRQRGIALHALIEHLANHEPAETVLHNACAVTGIQADDHRWSAWLAEAQQVTQHSAWPWLYPATSSPACQQWNELPVFAGNVYGIIDRVVIHGNTLYCVDYKTQRQGATTELVEHYQSQLAAYRYALQTIWPQHTVKTYLLFTATLELIEVADETIHTQKN